MCSLWEKWRDKFKRARVYIHTRHKKLRYKAFAKYREKLIKNYIGIEKFNKMSESMKIRTLESLTPPKYISHFNNVMTKDGYEITTIRKPLPRGKLCIKPGVLKQEVRDALLIKTSKTCHLKGYFPFRYGYSPGKIKGNFNKFYEVLRNIDYKGPEELNYDPFEHDRMIVPGNWPFQYKDIQKMSEPIDYKFDDDTIKTAIRKRLLFNKLELPFITEDINHFDVYRVETNENANSGIYSSKMFGGKHKKADRYIRPIAEHLYHIISQNVCVDNGIWSIGGRVRRQKEHDINKDLRGRIIMMPEGPQKILGLVFASRIYEKLGIINYGNPSNELQIGRNDFHGNFIEYSKYFKAKGFNTLECDIKLFDATVHERPMVHAFGLIRSCFKKSEEFDRIFLYFMSGTIYKNVLTPGRLIYKFMKGVPSGSPFTSILGSLVNWINWTTFLYVKFPHHYMQFHINLFGDDIIINMPDWCDKPADWWAREFMECTGQKLDPCVIKTFHSDKFWKRPSLLKTVPNYDLPTRLFSDTLLSATFVKRRQSSWESYAQHFTALMYSSPFDFYALDWLMRARTYCLNKMPNKENLWVQWKTTERRRRIEDRFSYKQIVRNYLSCRVYGYEFTKNVDLGNKPKKVQPVYNLFFRYLPVSERKLLALLPSEITCV